MSKATRTITNAAVDAGNYTLTETDGPAGYTATAWTCVNAAGDPVTVTDGTVTIALGANLTCTITNNDQAAQLTLVEDRHQRQRRHRRRHRLDPDRRRPHRRVTGVDGDPTSHQRSPSTPATTP